MPKRRPPYPAEFRAEIAGDLGLTAETLRSGVKQADRDEGRRDEGVTTQEREELRRWRREHRILRAERAILQKAAAFFATETGAIR